MSKDRPAPTRNTDSRDKMLMIVGAVVVVIATILYVLGVTYKPAYGADRTANSAVSAATNASGQRVYTVHLAIQQSVGLGPNAAWLGYQTETGAPHPGTFLSLPRNTLVTFVIHNYDSQTQLRNPFFTLVQGTVGSTESVNGKSLKVMNPNVTSHTFTIPDWGVSVPMEGISSNAKPNSFETMTFTVRTPNKSGVYRWQCIVPCGWGLYGNGGPMSELGYMQGLITLS